MNQALIGFGYWGKKLFHALDNQAYLVDTNPAQIPPHLKPMELDLTTLLTDTQIASVYVATPEETHYELVKQLLSHGKHVFVEKPLCLHHSQAEELCQLAIEQRLHLWVDYVFLFDPVLAQIKRLIETGALGTLYQIKSQRYSHDIIKPKINIIEDLAIHDIYVAEYLIGEKIPIDLRLNETGQNSTPENLAAPVKVEIQTAQAQVSFSVSDTSYSASYKWLAPRKQRQLKLIGSQGELTWKVTSDHQVLQLNNQKLALVTAEVSALERSVAQFQTQVTSSLGKADISRYNDYIRHSQILELLSHAYSTLQSATPTRPTQN